MQPHTTHRPWSPHATGQAQGQRRGTGPRMAHTPPRSRPIPQHFGRQHFAVRSGFDGGGPRVGAVGDDEPKHEGPLCKGRRREARGAPSPAPLLDAAGAHGAPGSHPPAPPATQPPGPVTPYPAMYEKGGGGEWGGVKGVWLGPPLLPGSPCGPRRRRAETFEASILLTPKAPQQTLGCQPQTLEGEGGGTPPSSSVRPVYYTPCPYLRLSAGH